MGFAIIRLAEITANEDLLSGDWAGADKQLVGCVQERKR